MDIAELIRTLKKSTEEMQEMTRRQWESNQRWRRENGIPEPEPTELELLLQKWEQARVAPQSPEPEGEELLLPEPEGEELLWPELEGKEVKSPPPPQP
ncbi:UNVERIFIED_CONTAM: hypothetical protein FKN15_044982 [Acipenser sinensis]